MAEVASATVMTGLSPGVDGGLEGIRIPYPVTVTVVLSRVAEVIFSPLAMRPVKGSVTTSAAERTLMLTLPFAVPPRPLGTTASMAVSVNPS